MASNLNSTLPAAPAGSTNVVWQTDGAGNDSAYVPGFTGAPNVVTSVDLTAQAANIGATTALAVTVSARYRVSLYIVESQVATTSSTLPSVVLTWTDVDNTTSQSLTLTAGTPSANTLTTLAQSTNFISAKSSSNIQYSTTSYASLGGTPMQYALHIKIEQL